MNLRENTQHTKNSFLQFSQKQRKIFQICFLHVVGNKKTHLFHMHIFHLLSLMGNGCRFSSQKCVSEKQFSHEIRG